jgi:hypothetical protein
MTSNRMPAASCLLLLALTCSATPVAAASPCDGATHPSQCGWLDAGSLPPFVRDAIQAKGGTLGPGNVLVLTSGDPLDADTEISTDVAQNGCGTNPDGWETFDCELLDQFVPPEDGLVLALSSEWFGDGAAFVRLRRVSALRTRPAPVGNPGRARGLPLGSSASWTTPLSWWRPEHWPAA